MMPVLKIILLICFAGLVMVVTKNRIANPEMRIQFFDDLEKNKNLLRRTFLLTVVRSKNLLRRTFLFASAQSKKRLRKFMVFLSRFGNEKGRIFLAVMKKFFPRLRKGFLLFLRDIKRLLVSLKHTFTQQAKELREDMKAFELPLHKEDFLERLHKETKKEERKDKEEVDFGLEEKEEEIKGFQVSRLSKEYVKKETEIDTHILEKKERGLIEAIAKHPHNPTFYKKLGKIYLQMDNKEDAKNCLEYALKLGARDPEVKSLLGEIGKSPVH